MFFTERTIKIKTGSLKLHIDTCQKDCAYLKEWFNTRLSVDTNLQVKEVMGGMQQTGAYLCVCWCLFPNLFMVGIGRMMNAMIDDKLADGARSAVSIITLQYHIYTHYYTQDSSIVWHRLCWSRRFSSEWFTRANCPCRYCPFWICHKGPPRETHIQVKHLLC